MRIAVASAAAAGTPGPGQVDQVAGGRVAQPVDAALQALLRALELDPACETAANRIGLRPKQGVITTSVGDSPRSRSAARNIFIQNHQFVGFAKRVLYVLIEIKGQEGLQIDQFDGNSEQGQFFNR